jgi:predicted lipid-binding transport protein (Tim44 family)
MFGLRALVLSVMVTALLGGVSSFVVGIKRYAQGKADDKQRSDLVIARLVSEHRAAVLEANAKADAITESWRMARQGAERDQERERAAVRATLAAVNADRGELRDQLAAAARGGVEAGSDTVAACRDRAAAFGDVLDQALQAHAVCTAEAEELASGVRALRSAWPSGQPAEVAQSGAQSSSAPK